MGGQVLSLVSPYLTNIRPTGADGIRADCPLCGSKRAFVVSAREGGWLCWSCKSSGSITSFLYKVAHLNSRQVDRALEGFKTSVGVSDRAKKRASLREKWVTLPEYVLAAYEQTPAELEEAGFDADILQAHGVGIDETNNRIVFPIRDVMGRLAAISGRARSEFQIPRYKVYDANPPSNSRRAGELYGVVPPFIPDNRKHLYGLDTVYAKKLHDPEDPSPIIITEGYKSTLWLRQLGYNAALGLQGSSMSPHQQRFLTRLRGPYYVMLDNEPGKNYPDKFGHCAAVDILRALSPSGKALLCLYENKPPRTAPDDLAPIEVVSMIENAKTLGQLARP